MKRIVCLLLGLLPIVTLMAETLSLSECAMLAREHYPAIAQYELLEKITNYNLSNASKIWLPQGNINAQATWQNDVASLPDLLTDMLAQQGVRYPGIEKNQYRVGVDVSQQIWDGGRSSANRRLIKSAGELGRRNIDLQLYELEGRIQDIYFAILLLDERIERASKSIAVTDSTLRQVKVMFDNGTAMKSDCEQIEARLLGMEQQKMQLISAKESYRRILEIFIGEEIGRRVLELPEENDYTSVAVHPQLNLFDAHVQNIREQANVVKSSTRPTLGAFLSGYYGYPGYNMFENMRSHDPQFNFMAGLRITWSLGALYTRKNSLAQLKTEQERVETDKRIFLFNNRIAEEEKDSQISALRSIMENDERIVALHKSVLNSARAQLRNGIIDATTLLTKITDEELAENELALHRIQLIQAIYNLNHIKNK